MQRASGGAMQRGGEGGFKLEPDDLGCVQDVLDLVEDLGWTKQQLQQELRKNRKALQIKKSGWVTWAAKARKELAKKGDTRLKGYAREWHIKNLRWYETNYEDVDLKTKLCPKPRAQWKALLEQYSGLVGSWGGWVEEEEEEEDEEEEVPSRGVSAKTAKLIKAIVTYSSFVVWDTRTRLGEKLEKKESLEQEIIRRGAGFAQTEQEKKDLKSATAAADKRWAAQKERAEHRQGWTLAQEDYLRIRLTETTTVKTTRKIRTWHVQKRSQRDLGKFDTMTKAEVRACFGGSLGSKLIKSVEGEKNVWHYIPPGKKDRTIDQGDADAPLLAYTQEEDTCVTSSAAAALHHICAVDPSGNKIAPLVNAMAVRMQDAVRASMAPPPPATKTTTRKTKKKKKKAFDYFATLRDLLDKTLKGWTVARPKSGEFDPLRSTLAPDEIVVLLLLDSSNSQGHAVALTERFVFDSNKARAMRRCANAFDRACLGGSSTKFVRFVNAIRLSPGSGKLGGRVRTSMAAAQKSRKRKR